MEWNTVLLILSPGDKLGIKPYNCHIWRKLDKLIIKEESNIYNDGMSDTATEEHNGQEENIHVILLRYLNI